MLMLMAGCGAGSDLLVFTDANNYAFQNDVQLRVVEVEAGADVHVDWSGLNVDVRGRPVTGITQMALSRVVYPLEETMSLISTNDLDAQAEAPESYLFDVGGRTEATLTEFEIFTEPFDPVALLGEDPNSTWLLSAVNYPGGRLDILDTLALVPVAGAQNHEVAVADGDMTLDWSVDLGHGAPLTAAPGLPKGGLDWSRWTADVFGHAIDPMKMDQLVIAHYEQPVSEVEQGFLRLDSIATEFYRAPVASQLDLRSLGDAVDASTGAAFSGFTTDGTWLAGFVCTSCSTPVPLGLTVVDVR